MSRISINIGSDGVAEIRVDTPESAENRLNHESFVALDEFLNGIERQLDMVESDDEIKAVVISSGKEKSFINGADPSEFLNFTLADEGRSYSLKAQEVTEKIENSRVPFVAAINGACLGVGLELAAACKYRIAADGRDVVLGLDQVDLGLIPCAGGMPRLVRLTGSKETLDMILSGETLDPHYSKQIGLVDEVVPGDLLQDIARKRANDLANRELVPRRQRFGGMTNALLRENPVSRRMFFDRARKQIKENREHYVSALRMTVEALEIGVSSFNRGLHVESVYFGELAVTNYSRQLIRTNISLDEITNKSKFSKRAHKLIKHAEKIAVVGEEYQAAGIACLAADNGIRVRMKGRDSEAAGRTLKACYDFFNDKLCRREIDELETEKRLDLISAATDYSGFRRADIVIEMAGEDAEVKRALLKEAEALPDAHFIYASNSFAVPIARIAAGARRPDKVVGVKISSPVFETELMEISAGENGSQETVGEMFEFARRLGKIPLVINGQTGFYTTRLQLTYFNESLNLLSEGVGAEDIEDAMVLFGFLEGPLSAMDEVGIDLVRKGYDNIYKQSGEKPKAHPLLDELIAEGRTGARGGRGFYRYDRDEKRIDKSLYKMLSGYEEGSKGLSHEYIQDRLVLALVNEAMVCLNEGVIGSAKEGDVGAMLGLGFPAYRGGPFRYMDSAGAGDILKKLHNLSVRYGTRYTPPVLLKSMAVGGDKFYEN
ncbi:MAG: 3-hydroxyacyl-CoA dehydrogenase NAD-binding domain-containing protein [Deltaproteobacteria bacterium]